MSKTATTWELMKSSWHVLMRDKVLLLFPVVSGIACFLVLVTFIVPVFGVGGAGMRSLARGTGGVAGYVVLFLYYLSNFFVVFYFNAALVDFVTTRLRGGEPTVGASLRAASSCLPQIAVWAVIASTVGLILKALESRAGFLGRIVISLIGVAWTLVTYFVVPIIIIERKGAFDAIGSSKDLLAKTWGKQIVSGLGYGIIGFLLTIPAIIVFIIAIVAVAGSQGQHVGSMGTLAVLAVLYLIGLGIVLGTLRAIFGVVLYLYAQTGNAPEGFSATDLRGAIQPAAV
jgi:hypothetical protein